MKTLRMITDSNILSEDIKYAVEIIIIIQRQLSIIQKHKDYTYQWKRCEQGWMKAKKNRITYKFNFDVHVQHLYKLLNEGYQTLQKHGRVPHPPLNSKKAVFVRSRFKFNHSGQP